LFFILQFIQLIDMGN